MPIILLMIIVATVYQLFFRYESWPSEDKPGARYEHDNLTGETRLIQAGVTRNVFARIIGQGEGDWNSEDNGGNHHFLEPLDEILHPSEGGHSSKADSKEDTPQVDLHDQRQVEKVARPVPIPREVVIASSAPPVPMTNAALESEETKNWAKPFAVRQVDLNQDGTIEEIIQNATDPDGLLDISIVKNGREIFYGRGQQISLLPTRSQGWADIALKIGAKTLQVFRYDAKEAAYKALSQKTAATATQSVSR